MVTTGGHTYAVVQVHDWTSECSNLGGVHWTFSVDGMGPQYFLHGGGHGIYGASSLPDGIRNLDRLPKPGLYYVAEVNLVVHDAAPVRDAGWCLGDLPVYSGTVLAVAPARDLAAARAQLAAIPTRGLPGADRINRNRR